MTLHLSPESEMNKVLAFKGVYHNLQAKGSMPINNIPYDTPPNTDLSVSNNADNVVPNGTITPSASTKFPSSTVLSPKATCNSSVASFVDNASSYISTLFAPYESTKIKNDKQTISNFLTQIIKRSKLSKTLVLYSMLYVAKISKCKAANLKNSPEFSNCAKRISLVSIIISHKFLNDNTFSMKTWSQISGLKISDLISMERWCLSVLNFNLNIDDISLKNMNYFILNISQTSHKRRRGSFTNSLSAKQISSKSFINKTSINDEQLHLHKRLKVSSL